MDSGKQYFWFRVMSEETAERSCIGDSFSLRYSHPIKWNRREELQDMFSTQEFRTISCPAPSSIGITDPLEGFVLNKQNPVISDGEGRIRVKKPIGVVDKRLKALCFNIKYATEEELTKHWIPEFACLYGMNKAVYAPLGSLLEHISRSESWPESCSGSTQPVGYASAGQSPWEVATEGVHHHPRIGEILTIIRGTPKSRIHALGSRSVGGTPLQETADAFFAAGNSLVKLKIYEPESEIRHFAWSPSFEPDSPCDIKIDRRAVRLINYQ